MSQTTLWPCQSCDFLNFEQFESCQACFRGRPNNYSANTITINKKIEPSTKLQSSKTYTQELPSHRSNNMQSNDEKEEKKLDTTSYDPKWDTIFNRDYFDLSQMNDCEKYLHKIMQNRIMFLDGGMGTTIQKFKFTESDFRGDKFKDHNKPLKGDNDLLVLTQPE
eukprot:275850_1